MSPLLALVVFLAVGAGFVLGSVYEAIRDGGSQHHAARAHALTHQVRQLRQQHRTGLQPTSTDPAADHRRST